jgi:hypothetical protein
MSEQTQQADDPSDDRYWRNVLPSEILQPDDMMRTMAGLWLRTTVPGKFASDGCGRTYRRRIEPQPEAQPQPQPEPQATQDDPSGEGWRDVGPDELLQDGDMFWLIDHWELTQNVGTKSSLYGNGYRRRIEPQPEAQPQTQQADDPSGPGWRDLGLDEPIEQGDVYTPDGYNWLESDSIGRRPIEFPNRLEYPYLRYRRRIEPQQPSDSEPETVDSWEMRLAKMTQWNLELEALVAEAERSGQQVDAELQQLREQVRDLTRQTQVDALELQQLREQVQTLTRERDRYRNQLAGAIEHSKAPEAQAQLVDRLQKWLRPVLEVVSDHPDHSSILAASVLEFLPQIASRLIEE